jgi:hypothetical protein
MAAMAGRPHDLLNEIEVVDEQPLIIHVNLDGNPYDYLDAPPLTQGR